jgi:hypothetical protein
MLKKRQRQRRLPLRKQPSETLMIADIHEKKHDEFNAVLRPVFGTLKRY